MPKTSSDRAADLARVGVGLHGPTTMPGAGEHAAGAGLTRTNLHGPTMGTRWSVRYDAVADLDHGGMQRDLAAAVEAVDRQMSPWKADSDLVRLNQAPPDQWIALPAEMMEVLGRALDIGRLSGGAFDVAVGALVDAWGFGAPRDTPDPAAIRAAARATRYPAHQWLELDRAAGRACKRAPMQLDLCGIAKGHAVDRMAIVVQRHGVAHALLALDGELRACGGQADGRPWAVAVESPQPGRRAAHGVIEIADKAVATSGDYRRWVEVGAARLSHTMDPVRAAPLRNAVASVTVVAPDCTGADAWATALLVAGPDEGLALARRLGLDALFMLRGEKRCVELGSGYFARPADGVEP